MTRFKAGMAGALLTLLSVAGGAVAQDADTKAAPATQAPATQAPAAKAAPPAETKAPAAPAAPAASSTAPAKAAPAKATTAKATSAKVVATAPKGIVGEVVDPACWIVNGAKGDTHKECALACAKAGQVLAIVERKTNKLFLIATERPGEDPNKGLIDYCGQTVLAKGRTFTRGGVTAIQLSSVEPYNAKAAP